MYTDGVPEANNAEEEFFGTGRMLDALRSAENESAERILETVKHAVQDFAGDAPQFDDLTMLCLEYHG